ncbi:RING-H2 finger protein ATL74-like isoform X2 [Malania oleifera]|uniref:RING-H2 finger protein ATL74-like isoform X2 n=1 Tax=Malania oleifera TaxID=397392 RepID=UPI0025AE078C|nr:RING-H2 finger protein ATL74-like isoform X2 [Malania oleifera]
MEIVVFAILSVLIICLLITVHACILGRVFGRGNENGIWFTKGETQGKKLPCFNYREGDEENGPTDCAVCLENFKTGEECRLLPNCRHSFHRQCIDLWLLKTPICPIRRTSAMAEKICGLPGTESSISSNVGIELAQRVEETTDEESQKA